MANTVFTKDSDAVLDYAFDWNDTTDPWLATGETISSYTVTVETGLTKDSDSHASGVVTVWLSGGTVGTTYRVECEITTSAGRKDERSMWIKVAQR